jgi:hypothetical protein
MQLSLTARAQSMSDRRRPSPSSRDAQGWGAKRTLSIAASLFLANCEGTITTDLAVEAAADPDIRQIVVPFAGVEFRRDDGSSARVEFNSTEALDLLDLVGGQSLRLLTNEELPSGSYTGIRLLFGTTSRDDTYVIDGIGGARELTIVEGDYAETAFTIADDERSHDSLVVALELRLSLSVSNERYRLAPYLRAVHADDAGTIEGTVTAPCLTNAAARSPAVYLFQGEGIAPDDFGSSGAQPFATAPVIQTVERFTYELRFIPEGRYTLSFTCRGDREDPTVDDAIEFRGTRNIRLERAQTLQRDLSG